MPADPQEAAHFEKSLADKSLARPQGSKTSSRRSITRRRHHGTTDAKSTPSPLSPGARRAGCLSFDRRSFIGHAALAGAGWLTTAGVMLARAAAPPGKARVPAKSIIVLWMGGGPSQLETFDPHPGTEIAAGTGAIDTAVRGVQLAPGLAGSPRRWARVALVRSMVSKEGDHERGTYS